MNLLQHETSPYLLQHATNPVHWFPWGEEAFAKAQKENKPILVSIGYSACHWCHVMEHESFENQEVADLMNSMYINIKVDREEHPDVDHMYMDAVQAMTGSGGWPLNIFLTPEKKPFYGGTYFPPQRAHNRASWKEVLINVSQHFTQNRNDVEHQAEQLLNHLKNSEKIGSQISDETLVPEFDFNNLRDKILANADKQEGGFGSAPKFPSTFVINYLLHDNQISKNEESLSQAILSLDKMMMGGIYDHLGGGFARYSTDKYWIAPHFEKMLYDNALLMEVYCKAFSITKDERYKKIVYDIISWLRNEMTSSEFGFYAAQDADSEGVEGKYFTWSYEELESILGEDFDDFKSYYTIRKDGNWEHTNILFTTYDTINHASDSFKLKIETINKKLLDIRSQRVKPGTDDKILLGWNAMMLKALTHAYMQFQDESIFYLAQKNVDFLLAKFPSEEFLYYHTYKNGVAKIPAYADDLTYMANAFIEFGHATSNTFYYSKAKEIVDYLITHFKDEDGSLIDFSNHKFKKVEVNKKEIYDGATPSPNSILNDVLNKLHLIFMNASYNDLSQRMQKIVAVHVKNYPASFGIWALSFYMKSLLPIEISIIGEDAQKYYLELYTKIRKPNVIYIVSDKEEEIIDSLKGKYHRGETRIFICKDFSCLPPLTDTKEAIKVFF